MQILQYGVLCFGILQMLQIYHDMQHITEWESPLQRAWEALHNKYDTLQFIAGRILQILNNSAHNTVLQCLMELAITCWYLTGGVPCYNLHVATFLLYMHLIFTMEKNGCTGTSKNYHAYWTNA